MRLMKATGHDRNKQPIDFYKNACLINNFVVETSGADSKKDRSQM